MIRLLAVAALAGVLVVALFSWRAAPHEARPPGATEAPPPPGAPPAPAPPARPASTTAGHSEEKPAGVERIEVTYLYTPRSVYELAAHSGCLAIGAQAAKVGDKPLETSIDGFAEPRTQYKMELSSVLGASGVPSDAGPSCEEGAEVVVSVGGGESGSKTYAVSANEPGEGADPPAALPEREADSPLRPEGAYLMALVYNEEEGFYDVVGQPYGDFPLDQLSEAMVKKVERWGHQSDVGRSLPATNKEEK